jgi:predicted 3-demethylubiquinone-9 3-methyltransferase (glyoxalase superfamily)
MKIEQKIKPCLWFDTQAEQAANFYVSIFDDSKILNMSRYGEVGPGEPGTVLTVTFQLGGQEFMALNGGPMFQFSEAISLYVDCEDQAEVDELWARLTDGGEESMCGWLKDRYGLSWQIVPRALGEMMQDEDPARAQRVMAALLQMKKIDLADLQRAYDAVPL